MMMPQTIPKESAPNYFRLMVVRMWAGSERLAREVWQAYVRLFPHAAQTTTFALDQIFEGVLSGAPVDAMYARLAQCQRLLPPQHLLAVTAALSPESHGRRRKD